MDRARLLTGIAPDEIDRVLDVSHGDPHRVLGPHATESGILVRVLRPDAEAVRLVPADAGVAAVQLERVDERGLFAGHVEGAALPFLYQLEVTNFFGRSQVLHDPYAFPPTLGEIDIHLAGEGHHWRLWEKLGAHVTRADNVDGVAFAVWAPNARRVSVVGDFNGWDGRYHAMRLLGASGIWELFVPGLAPGQRYKYELATPSGATVLKVDPVAAQGELRPANASVIAPTSRHEWGDAAWVARRRAADPKRAPMSVYEVHLGSWRRVPEEGDRWLGYRELAPLLADYVVEMGFTHVELLPVLEHPFDGSWGYQVTGYFAPTARHGSPDDFRWFVDHLHRRGIGVLLDWVPAHFPTDAHGLARFDGTALYEHSDPRQGFHPDWGTAVFNFGRYEVKNFLIANALFWLEEMHVDGLRVDAVASMLYLDYSREAGEWVPNRFGGRENLEAVDFLRELNTVVQERQPGALVIAEESTAWPAVSRPAYLGGLGFGFKWNMGWMHDTLDYFSKDPLFRRFHHDRLTFGLLYAYSESFILPLSHDEVVHMKGSLLAKMPGDGWQKFANLRALYAWMWCHPGKKLLFMGGEMGHGREWSEARSLDWSQLELPPHRGVRALVKDLNAFYREQPALWEADGEPAGFQWSVVGDNDQSVAAFVRFDRAQRSQVVCVLNATPVVRRRYRLGVPAEGVYREALNTDAEAYGGSNVGNLGEVVARPIASHGFPYSIELTLPPLAVIVLKGPEIPLREPPTVESKPAQGGATT